jgi:hypothetical protein
MRVIALAMLCGGLSACNSTGNASPYEAIYGNDPAVYSGGYSAGFDGYNTGAATNQNFFYKNNSMLSR